MSHRTAWKRIAVLSMALTPLLISRGQPSWAEVRVDSETIVRYFERDTDDKSDQPVLPIYEYLRIDAGELEGDGFSVHAYGWGRLDPMDNFYDDETAGEFLYGYLQYASSERGYSARLGRQYVFTGVSNESLDGLRLTMELTSYFSLDAYGGSPLAVEEVDGRDGDSIWGARLGHHFGTLYDVGVSYKRLANDGDIADEKLGIDSYLYLPHNISVAGFSTYNLESDGWAEHSYEGRWGIGNFLIRPRYQRFEYDDYFDDKDATAAPFRFLVDSGETVDILGGDVSWFPTDPLEFVLDVKHYSYDVMDDDSMYYAGRVVFHGDDLTQVGGELGVMDGGTSATEYVLGRGYFYWDASVGFLDFLTGDFLYVDYDQDINGEDTAIFTSLGTGSNFLDDALEVKLSGDASYDPYFDHDYRGMLSVRYLLDF